MQDYQFLTRSFPRVQDARQAGPEEGMAMPRQLVPGEMTSGHCPCGGGCPRCSTPETAQTPFFQKKENPASVPATKPAQTSAPEEATCPSQGCTQKKCTEIKTALTQAQARVREAITDLEPGMAEGASAKSLKESTRQALEWHFRTTDAKNIRTIRKNLENIEQRLNQGPEIVTCNDPKHYCYFLRFIPTATAYSYRTTAFPITVCPPFFWESSKEQMITLVHEAGHNIGLPKSPLEREVYISGHEYRALSTEEALVTTDAYANFVADNHYGVPTRLFFGMGVGSGLALTGGKPSLALTYGINMEFNHPALSVLYPVMGLEFTYVPALGKSSSRLLSSMEIGLRLAPRGKRFYLDLRTGGFIGIEDRDNKFGGIITGAGFHYQPGSFDLSLFWKRYNTILSGMGDTTILGVGAGMSF